MTNMHVASTIAAVVGLTSPKLLVLLVQTLVCLPAVQAALPRPKTTMSVAMTNQWPVHLELP